MYGENSARLRDCLATLLDQYHVNHRVLREVSRTPSEQSVEERQAAVGDQVRRYRRTIISWCHQALAQADPNPMSNHYLEVRQPHAPETRLRHSLQRLLDRNPGPLPSTDELTTRQEIAILELWRQAAKAATQGERDFDHGLGEGLLDHREWLTLAGDIADITKAIVILDRRYQHLPGWPKLYGIRWIDRYIAECTSATRTLYSKPDYNIDWRGWHPSDPDVADDADPIVHVLAAEHRLLNSLDAVPSMANLRLLLSSQRELSNLAANRARDLAPEQAARFRTRERAYGTLEQASHPTGGLAGTGAAATQHSADAATRLAAIKVGDRIPVDALRNLDKLFRHVDNALARAIEHGFNTHIYLVRRTLPRIDPTDGRLTHQQRGVFEPLRQEGRAPLIAAARRYLRSDPPRMAAPGDAAITRADFRAALERTVRRSDGMSI